MPKIKPAGRPCFAIGNLMDKDYYYYDGGELDGMIVAFPSKKDAEEFLRVNHLEGEAFIVDLTTAGDLGNIREALKRVR